MSSFEFSITSDESEAFATLSGDFNPLHLDPVAARRTQFGGTVVHGVHVVLCAIDGILRAGERFDAESLQVTFANPIPTGQRVLVTYTMDSVSRALKFAVRAGDAGSVVAVMKLGVDAARPEALALPQTVFQHAEPELEAYPPTTRNGQVELALNTDLLAALFPALGRLGHGLVADLLATTRIVGMKCPGRNSIYSGFKLNRVKRTDPAATQEMHYEVAKTDDRFALIVVRVSGACLAGNVEAFFRPSNAPQKLPAEIERFVAPVQYRSHRVLVIGGSRGLGEITAKILAAGGSDLTITYARGKDDAERVREECARLGGTCRTAHFDVEEVGGTETPPWLDGGSYSHVYFFASPPIKRNATGLWNQTLFERFAQTYVSAFASIVASLSGTNHEAEKPTKYFYPSTVFLDQDAVEFGEYCVAKAAGERLCDQLSRKLKIAISRPRLPMMRTDQTLGVRDSSAAEPFDVMLEAIRNFQSAEVV